MRKSVIGLALLVAASASAEQAPVPVSILFGGFATHLGLKSYTWEGERHELKTAYPMVGIEWAEWTLAAYQNTYGKTSVAFAKSWYWPITDNLSFEAKAGTVTGYEDTPIGLAVAPLATIGIDYEWHDWHTVLSYMPPVQSGSAGLLTIYFKYQF